MQGQRYPQQQWGGQPGYGQQMGGMQPMGYGQQMGGYNPQMQQQQQQAMLYQQQMQGPYAAQWQAYYAQQAAQQQQQTGEQTRAHPDTHPARSDAGWTVGRRCGRGGRRGDRRCRRRRTPTAAAGGVSCLQPARGPEKRERVCAQYSMLKFVGSETGCAEHLLPCHAARPSTDYSSHHAERSYVRPGALRSAHLPELPARVARCFMRASRGQRPSALRLPAPPGCHVARCDLAAHNARSS